MSHNHLVNMTIQKYCFLYFLLGWMPSVIVQGRVVINMGPVINDGHDCGPVFSQMYVFDNEDPAHEIKLRYRNIRLFSKESLSATEQNELEVNNFTVAYFYGL